MRLLPLPAAIIAAIVAAAPALAGPETDRLLAGHATGPGISCLRLRSVTGQTISPPGTIFFKVGARTYRSDVGPACPLERNRAIVTRSIGSDQCAGDIFQVVDPLTRINWGSCTFGKFVPWEAAPRAPK